MDNGICQIYPGQSVNNYVSDELIQIIKYLSKLSRINYFAIQLYYLLKYIEFYL